MDYGTEYMTIVCGLSVGLFVQITFDRVLQATGRTFYTMITQAVGAIINIIMDPILIFGLFGFPGWRWREPLWPPSWARSWPPACPFSST